MVDPKEESRSQSCNSRTSIRSSGYFLIAWMSFSVVDPMTTIAHTSNVMVVGSTVIPIVGIIDLPPFWLRPGIEIDREAGAKEACAFVKRMDFQPSTQAFDAAFSK